MMVDFSSKVRIIFFRGFEDHLVMVSTSKNQTRTASTCL